MKRLTGFFLAASIAGPGIASAQARLSMTFPPPLEYSISEPGSEAAVPPSLSDRSNYQTEGHIAGAILGAIGGYVLFRVSKDAQCPAPCRQNSNGAVPSILLGGAVGALFGGFLGSKIEKPADEPPVGRRR